MVRSRRYNILLRFIHFACRYSTFWLCVNIPMCEYSTVYSSTLSWMGIWAVPAVRACEQCSSVLCVTSRAHAQKCWSNSYAVVQRWRGIVKLGSNTSSMFFDDVFPFLWSACLCLLPILLLGYNTLWYTLWKLCPNFSTLHTSGGIGRAGNINVILQVRKQRLREVKGACSKSESETALLHWGPKSSAKKPSLHLKLGGSRLPWSSASIGPWPFQELFISLVTPSLSPGPLYVLLSSPTWL